MVEAIKRLFCLWFILVCFPSLWFEVHPWHAFDVFDILSKRMVYQEQKYPRLFLTLYFPLFFFFFLLADCSNMKLSNSVSIVLNRSPRSPLNCL